jgi:hypothetical protein
VLCVIRSVGCGTLPSCVILRVSTAGSLIVFLSQNCSERFRREICSNQTGNEAARISTDCYVTTSVAVYYNSPTYGHTIGQDSVILPPCVFFHLMTPQTNVFVYLMPYYFHFLRRIIHLLKRKEIVTGLGLDDRRMADSYSDMGRVISIFPSRSDQP